LADGPSRTQIYTARLTFAVLLFLIALGVVWPGVSFAHLERLWDDILARPGGPMTFRFILQPAMAAIAALRDGVSDARLGRTPYARAIFRGVDGSRGERLWEGIVATARILILGMVMDGIYQWLVLKTFFPEQAVVVALLLAFAPYIALRGPIERIARHWIARPGSQT